MHQSICLSSLRHYQNISAFVVGRQNAYWLPKQRSETLPDCRVKPLNNCLDWPSQHAMLCDTVMTLSCLSAYSTWEASTRSVSPTTPTNHFLERFQTSLRQVVSSQHVCSNMFVGAIQLPKQIELILEPRRIGCMTSDLCCDIKSSNKLCST